MKYQFIILTSQLPQVLEVYKKTGGYLEVVSHNGLEFTTVISDNLSLLYHDDFNAWPHPPTPFLKQDESELKELQAILAKAEPDDIQKRDKIEIETTDYLDPPVVGKAGRTINTIETSIKIDGEEIYREILSDQECISDKSVLRQFERFLEKLKFAKMLRAHPGEQHVLLEE